MTIRCRGRMKNQSPLHIFQSMDNVTFTRILRIPCRCHHNANRRFLGPGQSVAVKITFARRLNNIKQVIIQPWQNHLGFRIPKPAVEFQNFGPLLRHHQTYKENTTEVQPASLH